jgi:hypothetical protein
MKNIYKCECHTHLLEHHFEENLHYLNFWTHGANGEKPTLKRRIAEAWRLLTGKSLQGFWGVVLSREEALKLAETIYDEHYKGPKIF